MEIKSYIENNKKKFLNELFDLIRIPSISAVNEYKGSVREAAEFLKNQFENIGLDNCEICETNGHPIVYAEKIKDANLPTVLIYGHYDVQPVDPIELWDSDPFEPIIKKTDLHPKGAIFARGACDDKGQMLMHLKAIEILKENKALKNNIKFIIEGEEEIGSDHLEKFIRDYKKM